MPAESSYLGFLYALEEVAVYGYVTPLKLKIVVALALTDAVVRDADIISVRPPPLLFLSAILFERRVDIQGAALGVLPRRGQPVSQTPHAARRPERTRSASRQPRVDVFPPTRRRGRPCRGCAARRFQLIMKTCGPLFLFSTPLCGAF